MSRKLSIAILVLTVFCVVIVKNYACDPENDPPVAVLYADPTTTPIDVNVILDGSGSYDTDGTIVKYEWDWTNDGSYDYNETSGSAGDGAFDGNTVHAYSSPGTYTAKLRVTDDGSPTPPIKTDTDTCTVYVYGDYYVDDANGSDDNNGLSLETPFKTIQKAADTVIAGDTVNIRGGTYNEGILIDTGGTANLYITFQPYNNEQVIIQPGTIYTGWTQDGNDIYKKTINDFSSSYGRLIKKDGYAISRMNSYDGLLDPNITVTWVDTNDYDLFCFDDETNDVYLKLASGGDPNTDIYVVGGRGFTITNSPYVEINGLDIQYAYDGIKSYSDINAEYIRIVGCDITHIVEQGILSSANDLLIDDNYFAYVGRPLRAYDEVNYPDELMLSSHDHALYLIGDDAVVRNNIMEKAGGWPSIQSSGDNCEIYNNYIDGSFYGKGANIKLYNNIILNSTRLERTGLGRFGVYLMNTDFNADGAQIYNNVIKSLCGVRFPYHTDANNYIFENNIICTDDPTGYCIFTEKLDIASSVLNHNVYYGGEYYFVGYCDNGDCNNRSIWNNFAEYQADMNNPNNDGNEQDSFEADPCFVNVFDFAEETVANGSTTTFHVYDATFFEVNDVIEYNNDGVARTVTDVNTTTDIITIDVTDALVSNSLLEYSIRNWGIGATDMNEDFSLDANSLCIDAGDPNTDSNDVGTIDYDGNDRFVDGDSNSTDIIDIGPYEYDPNS